MNPNGRGRLKMYLGYAAGVGKTYQMLEDAQELRHQGVDVVVGYFEPHGRQDTIAKLNGLELIPRKTIEYRGTHLAATNLATDSPRRRSQNRPGEPNRVEGRPEGACLQKEFDILAFLMRHPNTPIAHAKLLQAVLGPRIHGELEYPRTYVRHLGKKSRKTPPGPSISLPNGGWGIASGTPRIPTHPSCQNLAYSAPVFM